MELEIVKTAKEVIKLLEENPERNVKNSLVNIFISVKNHPEQLKSVKDFESLGSAFLLMVNNGISNNIEDLRMITNIGYICFSKAILEDSNNVNSYKNRFTILLIAPEFLQYTVMRALDIVFNSNLLFDLERAQSEAIKVINKMELADIVVKPIIYERIDFARDRYKKLLQIFHQELSTGTKLADLALEGIEYHKHVITYLNQKVIIDNDLDFYENMRYNY